MTAPARYSDRDRAKDSVKRCRVDVLAIFSVSLVLYLLLGQETLYRNDGHNILERLNAGVVFSDRHPLALPIMRLACWVLDLIHTMPLHRALTIVSAIGTATGVALTYLAALTLGIDRRRSILTAALVGSTFPVMLFATLVEYHGLFFAFSQLAFLCCCRWILKPGWKWTVLVALSAQLTTFVHSSGAFLSLLLGCWFVASTHKNLSWKRSCGHAFAVIAIHIAILLLSVPILGAFGLWGGTLLTTDYRGFGMVIGVLENLDTLPQILWSEFVLPFSPSILLFALLASQKKHRSLVLLMLVAAAPYIAIAVLMLKDTEHGAYLIPLSAPIAIALVRSYRPVLLYGVVVLCLGVTTAFILDRDVLGPEYRRFAKGVLAASDHAKAGDKALPCVLTVEIGRLDMEQTLDERAAILVANPNISFERLTDVALRADDWIALRPGDARVFLRQRHPGQELMLSKQMEDYMLTARKPYDSSLIYPNGKATIERLRRDFEFEPRKVPDSPPYSFDGYILRDRPK